MCSLFKKFIAASAATIMLALPLTAHAAEQFTDVKPGAWYYEAVDYAVSEGLFNGTSPSTFDPEGGMTRGMFVTVLANKTENYSACQYTGSSFADVPADKWFAPAVEWATQNKLVGGVGGGRFAPNNSVTREQIAKILYDYAQRTGNDTSADTSSLQRFSDANSISSWARQAMVWAATHGVFKGDDGKLNPKGTATRAQVAQIFYNCREVLTYSILSEPDRVWVVDVPGHYETVTRLEVQEITVGEVGHWIDGYTTEWVYRCNVCGFVAPSVEGINAHLDSTIDWATMTGHGTYTMVSGEPQYTGEKVWIVDVPGKIEYKLVPVTEQVWVDEVGHWE